MRKFKLIPAGIAVILLAGCNTPEEQQAFNAATGALIGAGLGMAVSSEEDELKGALVGAGAGALLGNALTRGQSISPQPAPVQSTASRPPSPSGGQLGDPRTRAILSAHENAMRSALDTNTYQRWSTYGVQGNIYPTTQWEQNGQLCRGYDSVWTDGNTGERGNFAGSACRQQNGSWVII
ncbi:MAG: glycine zipper 2TM domain-containing protein [Rhodobacteraceae bacterium]|nr:glycine zipper 2TM domain-containing protein [Paracoccaceae bacterium]